MGWNRRCSAWKISREFQTKEATEWLASQKLDGKLPGGDVGFVSNRCLNGRPINWEAIASDVVEHWAGQWKESYGSVLLDVLGEFKPAMARKLKNACQ